MLTKKKLLDELNELKNKIDDLTKDVSTLTKDNQTKIKKYNEMVEFLKDVKISVSKVNFNVNDRGSIGVDIHYHIPKQSIYFNDENEIIMNKTFRAINMLNLISLDDMQKISILLEDAKRKNRVDNE